MDDYRNRADKSIFFHERNYRRDGEFHQSNAHYHRQMEIFYLLEGAVVIVVNSRAFHVEKGGILVIPPLLTHSSIYSNTHNSRMVINFSTDYFPPELAAAVDAPFYIERQPDAEEEIDALFRGIQKEYGSGKDYAQTALIHMISLLTIRLLRLRTRESLPVVQEDFIEKAISYIQKQYAGRIRITEAAQYCGVSPEHLSRTFKQKTTLHFNEYVLSYRLKQAEIQLIANGAKTITEIAYSCGFNDSNYFSSCFRKIYGITPSEFRHRYGSGERG